MGGLVRGLDTPKTNAELAQKVGSYIDVRDLSSAHVEVLAHEEAGNERYIIISSTSIPRWGAPHVVC